MPLLWQSCLKTWVRYASHSSPICCFSSPQNHVGITILATVFKLSSRLWEKKIIRKYLFKKREREKASRGYFCIDSLTHLFLQFVISVCYWTWIPEPITFRTCKSKSQEWNLKGGDGVGRRNKTSPNHLYPCLTLLKMVIPILPERHFTEIY